MPPKKKATNDSAGVTTIHPKDISPNVVSLSSSPSSSTSTSASPSPLLSSGDPRPIEQTAAKHTYDNYKRWDNLPDEVEVEEEASQPTSSSSDRGDEKDVDEDDGAISVSTSQMSDATSVVTTTAGDATVEYYSKNLTPENINKARNVIESQKTSNTQKVSSSSKKPLSKTQQLQEKREKEKLEDSLKDTEKATIDTPWFSETSSLLSTSTSSSSLPSSTTTSTSTSTSSSSLSYASSGCDALPEEEEEGSEEKRPQEIETSSSSSTNSFTSSSSSSPSPLSTVYAPTSKKPLAPLNEPSSVEIVGNLMAQLKRAEAEILRRDLIIARIRRELHDADLTEIVSSAQDAAAKLIDEGSCENRGRNEDEQEALTIDAIALVTEKLFLDGEIGIDQKAYVTLAILPAKGKEHFRVADIMDSFKDRPSIEVAELSKWIRKWTNAPPEAFDPYCSCRAWCKRMGKTIQATYGYTSTPIDLNKFSTTYNAATNFIEACNPKSFADASSD